MKRALGALLACIAVGHALGAEDDSSLGGTFKSGAQEIVSDALGAVKDARMSASRLAMLEKTLAEGPSPAALAELDQLARGGNPSALNFMGWLLDRGRGGVPRDSYKAAVYFRAAAIKGDTNGLYNLSIVLHQGRGITPNKTMAADLLRKAMGANHKYAAVRTGLLAEDKHRYDDAMRAYSMATSDKAHHVAIYRQGVLTFRGASGGSRPDPKNGVMMITRAATLWNPDAMASLSEIYAEGVFVPKNRVEAGKWLEILNLNPYRKKTTQPANVALGLTKQEMVDVARAVEIWLQFHPIPSGTDSPDYDSTIY